MGDTLNYIEGRMDEDELYAKIGWNSIKALLLVIGILILGFVVYSFIIPALSGGKSGFYLIYAIIAVIAFMYVFKPKTWLDKALWTVYALAYATVMYLTGECVVIAIILMGLLLAIACIGGEVTFTTIFTYRDLKEWVKDDKRHAEDAENAKKAKEALDEMKRNDDENPKEFA